MEDRRTFHPMGRLRPALSFFPDARRLVVSSPRMGSRGRLSTLPAGVSFKTPNRVSLCVKRHQRREVIMATGKGGGRHRPPRRNQFSEVNC